MFCPVRHLELVGRAVGLAALLGFAGVATGFAQTIIDSFGVGKKMDFLQTSSATPISHTIIGDPNGPYHFSGNLDGSNLNLISPVPKITLPNSTQYTLVGNSTSLGIGANYVTKPALDAAYPNGTYTFTAGTNTLPVSLGASDAYPSEIPQITGGTWDAQGNLLIDATNGTTLNFNGYSGYSGGAGGIITFVIYVVSGSTVGSELGGVESITLTGYSSDPAATSYAVPAGLLQADQTYYAELSFTRIVNLNTSFLPTVGSGTFVKTTGLLISTATPAVAPVFTTQPASQTVTIGANVILSAAASGNPVPTYQWRKDGANISGATLASFTINNAQLSDAGSYTIVASNSAGMATSNAALLAVNAPTVSPVFTTQPSSQTVTVGNSVTFTGVASGTPAPTYQWQKDGANIGGATSNSYAITSALSGDAGNYTVSATNSAGSVTSNVAALVVNPVPVAPAFTTQPVSQLGAAGTPVTLTAIASGTPAPTYQWQKDGTNISGATNGSYTLSSPTMDDSGSYTVVATNSAGSATSAAAVLTILAAPTNAVITITVE